MMQQRTLIRLAALVSVTAIWGGTFVLVKDAVAVYPVAAFLAYRFLLATAIFVPLARHVSWPAVRAGIPIGVVMGLGFLVQTIGLHMTLPSDTGLITGLFVVFVPLLEWLAFGRRVSRVTVAGLGIAVIGLILLVGGLPRQLALGDLLVAISALFYAAQIVLLSRRSPHYDTLSLTAGQMIGGAASFVVAALLPMGGGLALPPVAVLPAIVITAVLATALGFFVQSWAQRDLRATPAALVLLTEPAWATFFGVAFNGNPFPPIRVLGAALLFLTPVAITLAESRPVRRILTYMRGEEVATAA
jgi:drug/metabolite transporter (DMT)-like permease